MKPPELKLYNTLSRQLETFTPEHAPFVGMYVCGPTVYGDAHLGHARAYTTFDVVYRYLSYLGYKVRYVRNITDVGHLVNDADEGEDKIQKKARLEQLEPMEVVQQYTNSFHHDMDELNIIRPSIEPSASGHIPEQIKMIQEILDNGFAYEVSGSIYFNVDAYRAKYPYGELSGRNLDDLISGSSRRDLEGQDEKRGPHDFALWKRALPEHIMRWESPWSDGFPGWHLECSVMSRKYLGNHFDIHGGGMDLMFPHHECEIAQSKGATGHAPVKYWLHNNMITINGQKMAKSLNNGIALHELFSGNHHLLEQAYSPMTLRFFILQAHYRSTLDFSNEALQAAEKGYKRLMEALKTVEGLKPGSHSDADITQWQQQCLSAMSEDFNTPVLIAQLFEGVRIINSVANGQMQLTASDLEDLSGLFKTLVTEVLGFKAEAEGQDDKLDGLMQLLLRMRTEAKARKDYALSDQIRDQLLELGFEIKDSKDGTTYSVR